MCRKIYQINFILRDKICTRVQEFFIWSYKTKWHMSIHSILSTSNVTCILRVAIDRLTDIASLARNQWSRFIFYSYESLNDNNWSLIFSCFCYNDFQQSFGLSKRTRTQWTSGYSHTFTYHIHLYTFCKLYQKTIYVYVYSFLFATKQINLDNFANQLFSEKVFC